MMTIKLTLWDLALREEYLEEERRRRQIQRKAKAKRPLPDDLSLVTLYRLDGITLEALFQDIVPLLTTQGKSGNCVDPCEKILSVLAFYARGGYQSDIGKEAPMAQQTFSRSLKQVTLALNHPRILRKYMRFPQTRAERTVLKTGFYQMSGISGVCGCIDCTHIAIVKPDKFEERFLNRKHYHSLNVQMICDHKTRILNVDARYGGRTHDAFIWQYSQIKENLENLASAGETAILLGDSGYPLREYMMIPVEGALLNSPEDKYNQYQKKTRVTIERTFGILKGRWRCLLAARELHYSPEMAGKITIACSVLHNMCTDAGLTPVNLTAEELHVEEDLQQSIVNPNVSSAVALQREETSGSAL